jgi:hypothetical protein
MWIGTTQERISELLSPALGTLAHDGGELIAGFGDRLEDADWETLKKDLFSTSTGPQTES